MQAKVERLLRRIDLRVLGAPKKALAPGEVKPKWARTARDEMASLRAEVDGLRRRVEALEGGRADGQPGGAAAFDGTQAR